MNGTDFVATLPEKPGDERERLILQAVKNGNALLEWVTIKSVHDGHTLEVTVSADALRIGDTEDSVRPTPSHVTAQKIADYLDCVLPTSKLSDLIWSQADIVIEPQLGKPDSMMAYTSRMVGHSRKVDKALEGQDTSGKLVASVGKDWVQTKRLIPDKAANYGWHSKGGRYPAATNVGKKVWQPVGLAHFHMFADYSQVTRLIKVEALLDGKSVDIRDIAKDPALCELVTTEGAFDSWRHPRVPAPVAEKEAIPMPPPEDIPWLDPAKTLGERCVIWSLQERARGVKEEPKGSNNGPVVGRYLEACIRDGQPGFGAWLKKKGGNWCAASASAAAKACTLPGDNVPHKSRAGVVELVSDATKAGAYHTVKAVQGGTYEVKLGDLAIFDRSIPGRPETSWWRHVARVETVPNEYGAFRTIGGNEHDTWTLTPRQMNHSKLLGFIAYPQDVAAPVKAEEPDPNEWATFQRLIKLSDDVMNGRYGLEWAMKDFFDEDWDDEKEDEEFEIG